MPVWIVNQPSASTTQAALGDTNFILRLHSAYASIAMTNLASNPTLRSGRWANVALHVVVTDPSTGITGGSYPLTSIISTATSLSPPMRVYPGFVIDCSAGTPKRYWSGWLDRTHWATMASYATALYPYIPSGRTEMMFDIESYYIAGGAGGPYRYPTPEAITYYQSNTYCNPIGSPSTTPAVTISGTAGAAYAGDTLVIEITTGGARGSALFRWSTDAGSTWTETGVQTDTSVTLTGTGLTAAFETGTYTLGNTYTGIIVGPYPSLVEQDVLDAMDPFLSVITQLGIRPCMYPHEETSVAHQAIFAASGGYGEVWTESSFGFSRYYVQNKTSWNETVKEQLWDVATGLAAVYPRAEIRFVDNDDVLRTWGEQTAIEGVCGRLRPWIFDNNRSDQYEWATADWFTGAAFPDEAGTLNDVAHAIYMRAQCDTYLPYQKSLFTSSEVARFWKISAGASQIWGDSIYAHPDGVMLTRPSGAAATDFPTLRLYSQSDSPYSVLIPSYPGNATTWTIDFTCVLPTGFDAAEGVLCAINGESLDIAQVMVRSGNIDLRLHTTGTTYEYHRIVTGVSANTEYRVIFGRNGNDWRHGASTTTAGISPVLTATIVNFGGGYDASNNPRALGVSSTENLAGNTFCLLLKRGIHIWHRALTDDEVTWLLADYTRFYPFGVA